MTRPLSDRAWALVSVIPASGAISFERALLDARLPFAAAIAALGELRSRRLVEDVERPGRRALLRFTPAGLEAAVAGLLREARRQGWTP